MDSSNRNKGSKRKTYSPSFEVSDVPRKLRYQEENHEDLEKMVENLLSKDEKELDIQKGLTVLIKLQLHTNEKVNNILKHIDNTNLWLQNLDEALVDIEARISAIENAQKDDTSRMEDNQILKSINKNVSQKLTDLEDRSRRNNIVISGIEESDSETWEATEKLVNDLLETKLDLKEVEIERAHRIGRKRTESPRLIICKLLKYKDKERVLKNWSKLKGTNIFINEDFSEKTRTARFHLRNFAKDLRKNGIQKTRIKHNKLYADGKIFVYDSDTGVTSYSPTENNHPLV